MLFRSPFDVSALTVAVPLALSVPVLRAVVVVLVVNVPVVPVTAPFDVSAFTVAVLLAFSVVVTTPEPKVPVVPDTAPLLANELTVTAPLALIGPVAKLLVVTLVVNVPVSPVTAAPVLPMVEAYTAAATTLALLVKVATVTA